MKRIILVILLLLLLSLFAFSISMKQIPDCLNFKNRNNLPLSLLFLTGESNNEDPEFEFPPITEPVIDKAFINTFTINFIIVCGTGTLAGIGLIIYGFQDIIGLAGKGFFSYRLNKGIFLISSGLILSGISVTLLKTAIDSTL